MSLLDTSFPTERTLLLWDQEKARARAVTYNQKMNLAILDLDRTLVFRNGLADLYFQRTEDIGIDKDLARDFWEKNQGLPLQEQLIQLGAKEPESFIKDLFTEAAELPAEILPGAKELLLYLQKMKVKTILSSGSGQDLAQEALLETGLTSFFHLVLGSEPGQEKGLQHIQIIAENFDFDPRQAAFVGDRKRDMEIAKDAKIRYRIGVLFYPKKERERKDLLLGGANHVFGDLQEVKRFFENSVF